MPHTESFLFRGPSLCLCAWHMSPSATSSLFLRSHHVYISMVNAILSLCVTWMLSESSHNIPPQNEVNKYKCVQLLECSMDGKAPSHGDLPIEICMWRCVGRLCSMTFCCRFCFGSVWSPCTIISTFRNKTCMSSVLPCRRIRTRRDLDGDGQPALLHDGYGQPALLHGGDGQPPLLYDGDGQPALLHEKWWSLGTQMYSELRAFA